MSDTPLVSIIMNCYNSDTYLKEAIESVFAQKYQNWEIVFWDNQSTDKSAKIVDSYEDDRIKYFYAPDHTPLGEARNLAIDKAGGEWIAILDADDIWHQDKLSDAFALLKRFDKKDQVSLIYSKTKYMDSKGDTFGVYEEHYSGKIHDKLILRGDFVFISSAIFRTDILRKVGKIDTSLHFVEDYDLLLKVTKSYLTLCVDAYQTYYRVHDSNLTNSRAYEYEVENFEFLNNYSKSAELSYKLKTAIFLNNSSRMTAAIVKLSSKKDFNNISKLVKGYPQYLLLMPYYVIHFAVKRLFKQFSTASG